MAPSIPLDVTKLIEYNIHYVCEIQEVRGNLAFRDGLIASERFFFDLSVLCAQSGVSTDAVRRKLFAEITRLSTP